MHKMLALLGLLSFGCPAVPNTQTGTPKYQHASDDSADAPSDAPFAAPHGGYLFPFRELELEVIIDRNTTVIVFVYDAQGKAVYFDDLMNKAQLLIQTPGASEQIAISLQRNSANSFLGRLDSVAELPALERAMALRFSFSIRDVKANHTLSQCHSGHWATTTIKVQDSFSESLLRP